MTHRIRPTIFTLARWACIVAVVLAIISMLLYPGGTFHDPSRRGYSFFQNFLSDLGATVAWGGQPNYASAILFVTSFSALALVLAGATVALVKLYSSSKIRRRLSRTAGAAGVISCVSMIGAALTPPNLFLSLHIQFGSLAHAGCLLTSLLFAAVTARDNRVPRGVPAGWLLLAIVIIAHYSMQWGPGIETVQGLTFHVTAQKIAAIAVLAIFIYQSYKADGVATGPITKQAVSTAESNVDA